MELQPVRPAVSRPAPSRAAPPEQEAPPRDTFEPSPEPAPRRPERYLNIFWNQHQPYYKDEAADRFTQPWVRLHATKDYYDMAAILLDYPRVHVTINLSSSLLRQLEEYVDKLRAFADVESPRRGRLEAYPMGRVDPNMDLLVKPVEQWTPQERAQALDLFFQADFKAQIAPFPPYLRLWQKKQRGETFSDQDLRDLKVWHNLAWMDPSFRQGDVRLVGDKLDGTPMEPVESVTVVDDLVRKGLSGQGFTEQDAIDLALDQYKVMKYVVPIHRHLQNRKAPDGLPQVEVVTTPFYHPILPLIHDVNLAGRSNPGMPLPGDRLRAPEDAEAQVVKGIELYKRLFGRAPRGMWPGEGAVAEEVVPAFQKHGIRWIATGNEVAERSGWFGDNGMMYRIDADRTYIDHDGPGGSTDNSDAMSIVFRSLHDRIGFDYGAHIGKADGDQAALDFLGRVASWEHWNGVPRDLDVLVTNTADGENCWNNYAEDGIPFLRALYGRLNGPEAPVRTTTPEAYLAGHPLAEQWELEPLHAGSWVGGDFSTWIGEPSENDAWERLALARRALVQAGVPRPDPASPMPDPAVDRRAYFAWKAWESLYAAEGSDWFWWYGADQGDQGPADARFADDQRAHLLNSYVFARKAGYDLPYPERLRQPLDASTRPVEVPPLTGDPQVRLDPPGPDGSRRARAWLRAWTDSPEAGRVASVTVDLGPLGGERRVPLTAEGDTWKVSFTVPPQTRGTVVLPVTATSDRGIASEDFLVLHLEGKDQEQDGYLLRP